MNMKINEGKVLAEGLRPAIVVARFNDFITSRLLDGAVDAFVRHGGKQEDLTTVRVPGSFEIPLAAKKLAEREDVDMVICLGAVIRGATAHFDLVASECAKGIASVSLSSGKPVIFGVIAAESIEQAIERAGTKAGNKGSEAMLSGVEMANLLRSI